jgi:hypothetical protein
MECQLYSKTSSYEGVLEDEGVSESSNPTQVRQIPWKVWPLGDQPNSWPKPGVMSKPKQCQWHYLISLERAESSAHQTIDSPRRWELCPRRQQGVKATTNLSFGSIWHLSSIPSPLPMCQRSLPLPLLWKFSLEYIPKSLPNLLVAFCAFSTPN